MSRDSLIEAVVQRDLNEDACKMLQAEISRLQASEQHWRLWGQACEKKLNAQLDETCRLQAENERQSARIAELEEALRPFARRAADIDDAEDADEFASYFIDATEIGGISLGDCRKARATLKGDGEKGLHPDSRRLDWLVRNTCDDLPVDWPEGYACLEHNNGRWVVVDCRGQSWQHKVMGEGETYQEAIDAAIEEQGR